jgi:hypothetical protein
LLRFVDFTAVDTSLQLCKNKITVLFPLTLLTLIFKAYLKMFIAFFEQTRLKSDPCANILENKLERKAICFNFFYLTYSGQGSDFNRVCSKKAINILR